MMYQSRININHYLLLLMLLSSVVLMEPSPYDLLFMMMIAFGVAFSYLRIEERFLIPLLILMIFIVSNLVSLYFMIEIFVGIRYLFITMYLIISWYFIASIGNEKIMKTILKGYLYTAILTTLIGISAYFSLVPAKESFLMFDRIKSTFKDPNVFGPFLVLPALFSLALTEVYSIKRGMRILALLSFLLLTVGIVLSFSRAAWGNFALSLGMYFLITKKEYINRRVKTILLASIVAVPFLLYLTQLNVVQDLFTSRLMIKNYDSDRFATQQNAIVTALFNPLGKGPGQSEYVLQYAPHSLYARVFIENGIVGLLTILSLLVFSAFRAFTNYWKSTGEYAIFFIIIFAAIIGLIFNSFFVDTLHWRHFWLILALAYFPTIKSKRGGEET